MSTKKQTKEVQRIEPFNLNSQKDVGQFIPKLQNYITKNNLAIVIERNKYVLAEGWKFAAIAFGMTTIAKRPTLEPTAGEMLPVYKKKYHPNGKLGWQDKRYDLEEVRKTPEVKYSCEADIFDKNDRKIGYGFSICSNREELKRSMDEYAIASLAQTRAIAKAIKNLIGFIIKEAGYDETPAEEITEQMIFDKKPEPVKQPPKTKPEAKKEAANKAEDTQKIIDTVTENALLQTTTEELTSYWLSLDKPTRQIPGVIAAVERYGKVLKKKEAKSSTTKTLF